MLPLSSHVLDTSHFNISSLSSIEEAGKSIGECKFVVYNYHFKCENQHASKRPSCFTALAALSATYTNALDWAEDIVKGMLC